MSNTLPYLIEVTICLSAFAGLFVLLLKNEKNFLYNRIYLLLVPMLSLVIPALHYEFSESEAYSPLFYFTTQFQTPIEQTVLQETVQTSANYWMYIPLLVYLIGVLVVMFHLAAGIYAFYAFRSRHHITKTDGIEVIYDTETDNAFSFWNTMVIPCNSPNKNLIIEHERSHIRQKHSIDIVYYQLLTALLWFHPLIYILKKCLKEQHEFAADSEVIQNNRSKYLYASVLVHQSAIEPELSMPFANHFYYSNSIKNRLKMISKTEKSIIGKAKMAFPLPLLLALLFAFSFSVENFAQDTSEYNYEPGKMYLHIPPGEDFEEKKAKQLERLEELSQQEGKSFSPENVVFISSDQMDELTRSVNGPDVLNEGKYVLKWEGETISQNALVDKKTSNQPLTLYVDGEEVQLISNSIKLQVQLNDEHPIQYRTTTHVAMENGVLPKGFYKSIIESEFDVTDIHELLKLIFLINKFFVYCI